MTLVPLEAIYTSNDTYTEVPPAGADGFSSATITVDVPSPLPITIDRFKREEETTLLREFSYTATSTQVSVPYDYAIVLIQPSIEDHQQVWSITIRYNASGNAMLYTTGPSTHYYLVELGIGLYRFSNSGGVNYLSFSDFAFEDTRDTYVTVSRSLFNFDFSS